MAKKKSESDAEQSARFLEAAKKAEVDESGRMFQRAFKSVLKKKRAKTRKGS
jgi:hypothetical protein